MTKKLAINGFGRIGRCVLRAYFENQEKYKDLEIVAINDLAPLDTNLYLLKYDSVHGTFKYDAKIEGDSMVVDGKKIKVVSERDASKLPWKELGVDVVLECTGLFLTAELAQPHINAGAKKVMMSGPTKTPDQVKTIVYGVNDEQLTSSDTIISNASCTTNCLAPMAKALDKVLGIEEGHMTTIHSYTNDQNILDKVHKDKRRARAGALSMIPTSTGAAKAVALVLPQLKGKLDGVSIRVPTPDVSFVDLSFVSKKDTTVEEVNEIMMNAAKDPSMHGVLEVVTDPVVSIDMMGNPHSSIFDVSQTKVLNGKFVRVGSWYDNEWGYSNRMLDLCTIWK